MEEMIEYQEKLKQLFIAGLVTIDSMMNLTNALQQPGVKEVAKQIIDKKCKQIVKSQ